MYMQFQSRVQQTEIIFINLVVKVRDPRRNDESVNLGIHISCIVLMNSSYMNRWWRRTVTLGTG